MRPEAERAIEELMRLPTGERSEAAARLLASLDGEPDANAEAAWDQETKRRVEDLIHREGPARRAV